MDATDRKLIALLRADSRAPVATLARALKVSRGTVQNRIDRLRAQGVILGFTVKLQPEAESQRVRAIMAIAVEGEKSGRVLKALRGFPEIEAVHMTNGRWDMLAELSTENLADFSRMLDEVRLIEGISATETSLLLATHHL
ncbi:MAG TPA: Lrp/AsnC family transcriptional regulator [Caulobacteraceae bacterium]|jgi:DNA-binding Lrp family transcriptional regulator|nr:Lrp/AsnC family transcriptional regulator [Caulobacteraceae bacterium]